MLSYFYQKTEKTSRQQLDEDFGEFPPKPLVSEEIPYHFRIVRVRGPAHFFNFYAQWMAVLTALKSNPSSLYPDAYAMFSGITEHVIGLGDADTSHKEKQFKIKLPKQFVATIVALNSWRKQRSRKRCHGYYLPLMKHAAQVTIEGRASKRPQGIAPVISHEHIHFLQHCNGNTTGKAVPGSGAYLKEEKAGDATLLYLIEQREVEARLHEVVLSAYRAGHIMPLTLQGFLSMLCACKELTEWLPTICEMVGVEVTCNGPEFGTRDVNLAVDLEFLLIYSRDIEMMCRFATEVLPVMYGNLLKYYGDSCASASFLAQLDRPNLHDELYGLEAA